MRRVVNTPARFQGYFFALAHLATFPPSFCPLTLVKGGLLGECSPHEVPSTCFDFPAPGLAPCSSHQRFHHPAWCRSRRGHQGGGPLPPPFERVTPPSFCTLELAFGHPQVTTAPGGLSRSVFTPPWRRNFFGRRLFFSPPSVTFTFLPGPLVLTETRSLFLFTISSFSWCCFVVSLISTRY